MPKLKQSDLIIIAVLVLVIVGIVFLIFNLNGKVAQVTAQRKTEETKLAEVRDKVAKLKDLQALVASREDDMQRIATYIPNEEGQSDFITELSGLTAGSGVTLKSCKASEEVKPFPGLPEYLVYEWEVTFESNYPQLMRFLENLPAQERSTLVSQINISAGEADEEKGPSAIYVLNTKLTLDLISKAGGQDPLTKVAASAASDTAGQKKVSQ